MLAVRSLIACYPSLRRSLAVVRKLRFAHSVAYRIALFVIRPTAHHAIMRALTVNASHCAQLVAALFSLRPSFLFSSPPAPAIVSR
jgi:hypothetical protein